MGICVSGARAIALPATGLSVRAGAGTGIAVSVNDLFRKLALLTDYRLEPNFGPPRKGDVFRIALDNQKARDDLDWEPRVNLEKGLSLTVDYFREQVKALP